MTTAVYGTVNNIIINDMKKNANTKMLSFLYKFTLSSSYNEFGYNEHPAIGRKFFSSEKIPVNYIDIKNVRKNWYYLQRSDFCEYSCSLNGIQCNILHESYQIGNAQRDGCVTHGY